MLGGPSLRRGDTNEGLNIPPGIGCVEKHWSTGNVGISNANNRSYNLLHFEVLVLYLIIPL